MLLKLQVHHEEFIWACCILQPAVMCYGVRFVVIPCLPTGWLMASPWPMDTCHSVKSIPTSRTPSRFFYKWAAPLSAVAVRQSSLNTFRGEPCSSGHCWQMLSRCYTLPLAVRRSEAVVCVVCDQDRKISALVCTDKGTHVARIFTMTLKRHSAFCYDQK